MKNTLYDTCINKDDDTLYKLQQVHLFYIYLLHTLLFETDYNNLHPRNSDFLSFSVCEALFQLLPLPPSTAQPN